MSEVREGYKMTELGVVPLDWSAEVLENIVNAMYQGINTVADKVEYIENGVPILQAKHITSEKISFKGTKFLSEKTYTSYQDKFQPELGDLLLSNIGTIGKVYYVNDIYKYLIAWNIFLIKPSNSVDSKYLAYVLRRLKQVGYYDKITTGNATKFINKQQMGKIKVGLPKLKEQQKIADILSTVDTQIEQTEQMIEQTKELKHGLMQQLLTKGIGHTEFKNTEKGITPANWKIEKIDNIASVTKLAGYEFTEHIEYIEDGEIIALRALNVKNGKLVLKDLKFISLDVSQKLPRSQLKIDDLLFSYVGTVGEMAIIDMNNKYHLAPNVAKITVNSNMYAKFLMYFMYSALGRKEINKFLTTTSQPALSMGNIRAIKVIVPPLHEQQKIAEILSSVDNQIDIYEKEKDKYEELKKGLMQQLLTGKIRVKVDE